MEIDLGQYKTNGYLAIRNFFPAERIAQIYQEARTVFYLQFIRKGYTSVSMDSITEAEFNSMLFRLFEEDFSCLSNCGKQVQHLISLHLLSLDATIVDLLKSVGIKSPNISTRPVLYFNHPKLAKKKVYHTVDAHQDWRSMQGSLNSVVIWLPLIDINKDLGALQIIPGSHLWGLRTDSIETGFGMVALSESEKSQLIDVEVKRGDLLIFSSFLVHQSGDNITDAPRWSCHFRYNDLEEPSFIKRGFPHAYIYKPVDELLIPDFPAQDEVRNCF